MKKTTEEKIENHLFRGRKLTALQALDLFQTMRLSEYIRRLRVKHGYNKIEAETIVTPTNKRVASYSVPKKYLKK